MIIPAVVAPMKAFGQITLQLFAPLTIVESPSFHRNLLCFCNRIVTEPRNVSHQAKYVAKTLWAKLQNTRPLICISLNKNRLYCIKSGSSKDAA